MSRDNYTYMGMSGVSGTFGITGYAPPGTRPGDALHPPISPTNTGNTIANFIDNGIANDMINSNMSENDQSIEDDEYELEEDSEDVEESPPPHNNGRIYAARYLMENMHSTSEISGTLGISGTYGAINNMGGMIGRYPRNDVVSTIPMSYEEYINNTLNMVTEAFNANFAYRPSNQFNEEDVRAYLTPTLLSCFRSEENFDISFNGGRLIITIRPPAYASIIQLDTGLDSGWNIRREDDVIDF